MGFIHMEWKKNAEIRMEQISCWENYCYRQTILGSQKTDKELNTLRCGKGKYFSWVDDEEKMNWIR